MKNYGYINDSKSLVTKKYVDDRDITTLTLTSAKMTLTFGSTNTLQQAWPTFNQDTTGNAATATKLRTAVTLWGRSFDGSANVTGALTNTGSITPEANEAYNLGNSTKRFANIFGKNGDFSNTMSVAGATALGSTLSVTGATTLSSALSVSGNTEMNSVLNITGITGYAQGIRIHPNSGTSSIWFGATNATGFDAGMWGITVDTSSSATSFRIRGTDTYDSTAPVDYIKILNGGNVGIGTSTPTYRLHVVGTSYFTDNAKFGGYVGINTDANTSYRLYVNGTVRFGKVYLGGETYYLGSGAAASKLYSLSVGSATALSITNTGIVTVANTTALSGLTNTYSSSITASLKVGGGTVIGGSLGLYGSVYFGGTGYYIAWDSSNNAIHTNANFYADGWIASGGIGSAGGSGGGGVNVNTYAQIQAGTATGVASENSTYVPTSYALRQTYVTASGLSTTVTNLRAGGSHFTALLMRNTNNSPTITFQGEYDNNLGANITLGTLSGYRSTISSTTYSGLSVSSDLFIPNGKRIYTYTYGGAVRSVVYYPTSNYDELRFGDSAGATRIYGSSINLGEATGDSVNISGVTSITNTTDATGSSTAALKVSGGVYIAKTLIVNNNIVPNTSGSYTLGTSSKRFERAYIRYIDTPSGYNLRFCAAGGEAMNISTAGNVYIGGSTSASYKLQVAGTCYVSGNTTLNGTLSVGGLGVKGKAEYDLTYLFDTMAVDTAIPESTINVGTVVSQFCEGKATLFTSSSVTFGSTTYTARYDVFVGKRNTSMVLLYYFSSPNSGSAQMNYLELKYASGWKINAKYSVTL